jgi:hypothetical protein
MMRGDIPEQYRRLNAEDQKAFNRWLWTNTVVGAILLAGLIAFVFTLPGGDLVATTQNDTISTGAISTFTPLKRDVAGN